MRNPGLPKVAVFGLSSLEEMPPAEQLRSHYAASFETDAFVFQVYPDDGDLNRILKEFDPQAIVTVGTQRSYPRLMDSPYYIRRKWIHYTSAAEIRGIDILQCFLNASLPYRATSGKPAKISVFTPVYNTGREKLLRTYNSLESQTYRDWEWVVADDHSTDSETVATLAEIARDHRVVVNNLAKPSGNIGELKGHLCAIATGHIHVELDHDDVLTPDALHWIAAALAAHPECGMAYTNWAERYEGSDRCHDYGSDYGKGYGKAHWEEHAARYETFSSEPARYLVQDAININAKTIRHIVGVPNHIRAWTKEAYVQAGGYSRLHVADDYELMIRMFLTTRFVKIPKLCYIQFYNTSSIGNTQHSRNKEIQRLVRFLAAHYDRQIHERLLELGVDDFVWDDVRGASDVSRPNPAAESHCTRFFEG
jgi:glycosyltransferase involved in cell wall biosynthesis